ncbi:MAG TPA: hypothetical protein VGC55_12990 [Dokdonella sp.]
MSGYIRIAVAFIVAVGVAGSACAGQARLGVLDEESNLLPGKYFEQKAQFYVKKKDYRAALEMYQLSGFWGDKIAQYNAAVMLFNGIGVAQDKVLGTAWFRIAAESHGDLAERALSAANAELSDEQRHRADDAYATLAAKYGNDVALPRALARFQSDMNDSINRGMPGGPYQVYVSAGDGQPIMGTTYVRDRKTELSEMLGKITGNVTVGQVRTLPVSPSARTNASTTPLAGDDARDPPPAH